MAWRELWLLLRDTATAWVDDRAPSMGAALAFYALFSLVPVLIIAIAMTGVFFSEEAARSEIMAQIGGSSAMKAPRHSNQPLAWHATTPPAP